MALHPVVVPPWLGSAACVSYIYTYTQSIYSLYIHNELLLSHKKERNNAVCSNMEGSRDYNTNEVSQTEKDTYHVISLICRI